MNWSLQENKNASRPFVTFNGFSVGVQSSAELSKLILTIFHQAILADKMLYVSGVLGLDADAYLVGGGVVAQTRQALDNLAHVLQAGGSSLPGVIKTTILLQDIQDFPEVNRIYAEYFPRDFPARATYQVGKLPMGAAVEIEAIALSGDLVIEQAGSCPCAEKYQAILVEKTLYVSGVLGLDAQAQMVSGGAEAQARKALDNLALVLEAGGANLESVVKTTILLGDMDDFHIVEEVYRTYFPKDCPARASFQVGKLPMNAAVEIEAIALCGPVTIEEAGPCPCMHT